MTTRIDGANDGQVVTVAAGEVLEIALPENASTGYRWELDALPGGTEVVSDRFELPATEAVGAGGTRVFGIRSAQAGTVRARLRRAWESADPVAMYSVRVQPR